MIIVTGGAGFIGSNLVRGLNARGIDQVIVVDDLSDGTKFGNLVGCDIADYLDKDDFLSRLSTDSALPGDTRAVFHQGACSTTTEWDGRLMMRLNYEYSKSLLEQCMTRRIPLIYASSAAVYGTGGDFRETPGCEQPLNVYGYSKYLFDRFVTANAGGETQVVGLRYFNVYGPGEQHKGPQASVAYHFDRQVREDGEARLFRGSDGYPDGGQRRDFVYVDDVVDVNLWFLEHPEHSGIFNVGTGRSQSFNDVAEAVLAWHGRGAIRYIPFPDTLQGSYQSFTEADIGKLREAGYDPPFKTVEQGVPSYLDRLANQPR